MNRKKLFCALAAVVCLCAVMSDGPWWPAPNLAGLLGLAGCTLGAWCLEGVAT